ncbi:hypothetical protein SAMN05443246_5691 [Paenibacillus sp. GP183]|nr:hypothetical protein SAMN05443246_5691 [Paenibacillus sp. GP183]
MSRHNGGSRIFAKVLTRHFTNYYFRNKKRTNKPKLGCMIWFMIIFVILALISIAGYVFNP